MVTTSWRGHREYKREIPGTLTGPVPRGSRLASIIQQVCEKWALSWSHLPLPEPSCYCPRYCGTEKGHFHCSLSESLTSRICGHNRCLFLSRQVLCNLSNSYSNWNSSCKLCSQQTQLLAQTHLFHARKCALYIAPAPYNHFTNHSDSVDQDCRAQRS